MTISEILELKKNRQVLTVEPSATLRAAAQLLCELNIGALIVRRGEGDIEGIISERDILHQCAEKADMDEAVVSDAMSGDVLTITSDKDVRVAMELMCTARVRHLPVVDEDEILGIVTIGDVVKTMREVDNARFTTFLEQFTDGNKLIAEA